MKREIKLKKFLTIRYADPITALDLTDTYLCFGTMLGLSQYYTIETNKITKLSETQDEFISGIKIKNNSLYLCIGDVKINKYDLDNQSNNNNTNTDFITINNYKDEEIHQGNCEQCLTMLNNNYLVRTIIQFPKTQDEKPQTKEVIFFIKNIFNETDENDFMGKYKLSNYCVPFDFDGKNYIIIDFIEKTKRYFYVYDIILKEMKVNIEIEKLKNNKIGHVSHLKIIKNDMIFIVQNYNICEIRKFNLDLVKKLNIKSAEILAFDMLYENQENILEYSNERAVNEKEIEYIVILDIECNVILYNYKEDKSEILFNLEKDELKIDNDIKEQGFFIFEYPYYIKISRQYIAISTDYGCALFKY